ncbi:MAG: M1 family metallopeptidase [Actinomycetota bacterium]|nr:M1 family metallopeptidase [Actinomycetota bacterium]
MPDGDSHRLPYSVEPTRYDLTLSPDLDEASFTGEERVLVRVHRPTAEIVLNAADLSIHEAKLFADDGTIRPGRVTLDEANERAVIALEEPAPAGDHTLHLTFSGVLNDQLQGFYRSQFRDHDDVTRTIAATQFEATDARRAFPCWDEPDRKASFAVTLIVDEELVAISNSEVEEVTEAGPGRKQYRFAETMRMSTYLAAFVVGPFELSDPVDVDGVPLRVICVPGKSDLTDFALDVGTHALRFFTEYFGIPYPAGKLDLIGLPDFAMGAMENLGAVTFRESLLLIDPERATRMELERVADVIAHEIAHMWFGDLVTMRWWNGIWLNEAFATFMEMLCVDEFRPDWLRWVNFGLSRGSAMLTDGLDTTRPVEFPVDRPEDAEAMFDVLTYEKGAGVVRMLERYVGGEPFRRGIADYIAKHSYANTETTDLWDAIEAATGEPARSTMDSWIYQGGYPIVSVAADANGTVTLAQRRFRYLPGDHEAATVRWKVPVLIRASVGGEVIRHRMVMTEETVTVEVGGAPEWVVVNEGGWGFYRVRYDRELLDRITADTDHLDALERFNLASDTWAAVLAGLSPVGDFLTLARLYGEETHPSLWAAVLGPLEYLDRMMAPDERPLLQAYVRDLVAPAFERLGWSPVDEEGETTRALRATLLRALGVLGADPEVREKARQVQGSFFDDPESVDPDVAAAITAVVAATGSESDYERHLDRFANPATPQEEMRFLLSLAAFEDEGLARRTMDLGRTEVRTQNAPFLISQLLANRTVGPLAWELVKEHWDELMQRFPDNLHDRMLEGVTTLSVAQVADDVRAFLAEHPLATKQRTLEQILERLQIAVAFRQREAEGLGAAFEGV